MTGRGLILAAPRSGSGKTTLTLGLARALRRAGTPVTAAKSGPDYIDSAWLSAATGTPAYTLDAAAMSSERLAALASGDDLLLVEGAMGLFDGSDGGKGSVAELAAQLALPVILVVDCSATAQSVAPLIAGFAAHRPGLISGILLNRIGSDRHEALIREALSDQNLPILGAVRRSPALMRPSRHLGLVQAREAKDAEGFLDKAADTIAASVDLDALTALATKRPAPRKARRLLPPGQRIAVADDAAFAFTYPHILDDWRATGAKISTFSPLADQPIPEGADAVFLPGGYPELHALTLARAGTFRRSVRDAAAAGTTIRGECGGYMVLGHGLTDARGVTYPMCGVLDLETSFASRKLHLGYRRVVDPEGTAFTAHEFHFARVTRADGTPYLTATDLSGNALPDMGLCKGSVAGSFAHLIDYA